VKVELILNIPISAIIEINFKGITLRVNFEKEKINLPFYGLNLAPRQKTNTINLGSQFTRLGANIVIIKYCCFDEIHIVGDVPLNSLRNPNVGPKVKQQKNKIVGA
jgi:hypothetical protein